MKKTPAPGEHPDDLFRVELAMRVTQLREQDRQDESRLLDAIRTAKPAFSPEEDEVQRAHRIAVESGITPTCIANVLAFLWNRRAVLRLRRKELGLKEWKA